MEAEMHSQCDGVPCATVNLLALPSIQEDEC